MSTMTAQREPSPASPTAASSRSPFVRLTELIASIAPGKPVINLSVGEPQHAIPPFVGPVLAEWLYGASGYHAIWLAAVLISVVAVAVRWAGPETPRLEDRRPADQMGRLLPRLGVGPRLPLRRRATSVTTATNATLYFLRRMRFERKISNRLTKSPKSSKNISLRHIALNGE